MKTEDKLAICDILTRNILCAQASVQCESEMPSRTPDESDDYIKRNKKELVELRKIRELVEEM